MAYTDPSTVRLALSPDGDQMDVGSAASLGDPDLAAAIADASDEVNARLGGMYAVPFTDPVPDLVVTITVAIAGYLATLTYRRGDPLLPGDPVGLRYARAQSLLGQLSTGAATLGATGSPPAQTTGAAPVVTNALSGDLFTPADFPVPSRYPADLGTLSPTTF